MNICKWNDVRCSRKPDIKESGFFTNGEDYCARKMYIKWSTLFYSAKIVHG
jgi:hypothetical protein